MIIYTNEVDHMTNMAAMPIYGVWEYYQSYSNYDLGLTLTHFTPRSNLVT